MQTFTHFDTDVRRVDHKTNSKLIMVRTAVNKDKIDLRERWRLTLTPSFHLKCHKKGFVVRRMPARRSETGASVCFNTCYRQVKSPVAQLQQLTQFYTGPVSLIIIYSDSHIMSQLYSSNMPSTTVHSEILHPSYTHARGAAWSDAGMCQTTQISRARLL